MTGGNMKKSFSGLIIVALFSLAITGPACAPEPAPEPAPPFEKCIEASSFEDYFEKAGLADAGFEFDEWMSNWLVAVPIPIKTNLPDAEIYNIPFERAGGDVYTFPIIKSGNSYCDITDSNAEQLFAPIQKEDAIDYLVFRLVTLGSNIYSYERHTIFTREDYENYPCPQSVPESEKRITTMEESNDGFLINWVYYTPVGERCGYYEYKLEIGYTGTIQSLEASDKPFIDCGPGGIS
jgi:hypothetical protein